MYWHVHARGAYLCMAFSPTKDGWLAARAWAKNFHQWKGMRTFVVRLPEPARCQALTYPSWCCAR